MAIITIDEQKAHLGVIDDTDDNLISGQIDAAQAHVERLLGFDIAEEFASPLVVPSDLKQAVQMMAAHYYENREATIVGISAQELPLGVWDIVRERRNYSWGDDG